LLYYRLLYWGPLRAFFSRTSCASLNPRSRVRKAGLLQRRPVVGLPTSIRARRWPPAAHRALPWAAACRVREHVERSGFLDVSPETFISCWCTLVRGSTARGCGPLSLNWPVPGIQADPDDGLLAAAHDLGRLARDDPPLVPAAPTGGALGRVSTSCSRGPPGPSNFGVGHGLVSINFFGAGHRFTLLLSLSSNGLWSAFGPVRVVSGVWHNGAALVLLAFAVIWAMRILTGLCGG